MSEAGKEERVAAAFKTNRTYFEMMRTWHAEHGGVAIEPEVKELIESRCLPGRRILEAGCGEGSILIWFAKRYPEASFAGVDISDVGIGMARASAPKNAAFQAADLKRLPFPDGGFDFAYSQSVLEHVVGWEESIREVRRVLKPGGEFLIRVGNGGVRGKRLARALADYLLGRNEIEEMDPSLKLAAGDLESHQTNFDVQEIPSDILHKRLRDEGFKILWFSTRARAMHEGVRGWKGPALKLIGRLNFWPFNHLGPTSLVLARKER